MKEHFNFQFLWYDTDCSISNSKHFTYKKKKIKTERKQPQQYKNAVSTGKGNKKVKLYFHGNIFLLDHTKQQQKKNYSTCPQLPALSYKLSSEIRERKTENIN